jgi:uncharacterized lipoprotein YddW (UPF0748 family)
MRLLSQRTRRLAACLALFGLCVSASAPFARPASAQPAPEALVPDSEGTPEMRGLWVVRDGLTSRAEIKKIVATALANNFNALFVQARGRGDAWYDSPHEPRAESLTGTPRSFDPLQEIIEEAHSNGIQVHAWLNTFLSWSGSRPPRSSQHLWNAHRDWFAADRNGRVTAVPDSSREGAFLQPSNPNVQEHLFNVFAYVAENYDVDGIHFDYVRYANEKYDFSSGTLARFRAHLIEQIGAEQAKLFDARLPADRLAYVHAFGKEWAEWRRAQVTQLVTRIAQAVKEKKPWVAVSAAVFADQEDAIRYKGQDWRSWLQSGALDAVALMAYSANTERIVAQTQQALEVAGEKQVYVGIGAWRLQAHDVVEKITRVRSVGAAGINLFSYNDISRRPEYMNTLRRGAFASRSALPRMRWLPQRGTPPPKPDPKP